MSKPWFCCSNLFAVSKEISGSFNDCPVRSWRRKLTKSSGGWIRCFKSSTVTDPGHHKLCAVVWITNCSMNTWGFLVNLCSSHFWENLKLDETEVKWNMTSKKLIKNECPIGHVIVWERCELVRAGAIRIRPSGCFHEAMASWRCPSCWTEHPRAENFRIASGSWTLIRCRWAGQRSEGFKKNHLTSFPNIPTLIHTPCSYRAFYFQQF